jgi:hypothetical protein
MSFYRRLKESVYIFGEKLISFGDELFYIYFFKSTLFSRIFSQRIGISIGNLGRLFRDLFRIPVDMARGKNWNILYVGQRDGDRREIENLFFHDEEIDWQENGRASIWNLSKKIDQWLVEGNDLVITELSCILPSFTTKRIKFRILPWISQIVKLPDEIDELIAGSKKASKRNRINKLIRDGYSLKLSIDIKEFEYFYHELYVPNIRRRFGIRAVIMSYEGLYRWFKLGGLCLVMQNDNPVAGSVFVKKEGTYYVIVNGGLEATFDENVNLILYWFNLKNAFNLAAKDIDFGGSRPWLSDGVYEHKRRWGSGLRGIKHMPLHYVWNYYVNDLSVDQIDLINKIGLISRRKGKFYQIILTPKISLSQHDQNNQWGSEPSASGLHGLMIFNDDAKMGNQPNIVVARELDEREPFHQ